MCWGMISYNHKGHFHVWIPEIKEQCEAAKKEIASLNANFAA